MDKSATTSTAKTKQTQVGCALFVALGTKRNKTWWCSNTTAACTTGPPKKSFLGKNFLCGTIRGIPNSWGFLWHLATQGVGVSKTYLVHINLLTIDLIYWVTRSGKNILKKVPEMVFFLLQKKKKKKRKIVKTFSVKCKKGTLKDQAYFKTRCGPWDPAHLRSRDSKFTKVKFTSHSNTTK